MKTPEQIAEKLDALHREGKKPVILSLTESERKEILSMFDSLRSALERLGYKLNYAEGGGAFLVRPEGLCFVPVKLVPLWRASPPMWACTVKTLAD
ncbi:MAG: hypothetical protein PHV42_00470 [Candidatus Pacebacteria bacterium]|nr:hypothetical protein [Candidatus Paceibacterota bacterium]